MQLADAHARGHIAAGLSYDLRKCFDSVPVNLALDLFLTRGCDVVIVQALRSFYNAHTKHFRLDGHYSKAFKPSCGIVQGCPLSMLILASLVTCWLEHNEEAIPSAISRSYADDMSSVLEGENRKTVQQGLQKIHYSTQKFTSTAGLQINLKKTFTFGHKSLKNAVPQIQDHQSVFRLVGCSIKIPQQLMWTPSEQKRMLEWVKVVQRIQTLPQSWNAKVSILQSIMPKLTFGQGMHVLHASKDVMRSMRATVVRALLNAYNYNPAPNVIFALLAPPSIDPAYALQLSAFNLIRRNFATTHLRRQLQTKLTAHHHTHDDPVARIQQLLDSPFFRNTMLQFLQERLRPHKWQHELRTEYRTYMWENLARDRAQHYDGVQMGVNRAKTCLWLHRLQIEADDLQKKCDADEEIGPTPEQDHRLNLRSYACFFPVDFKTRREHTGTRIKMAKSCAFVKTASHLFITFHGFALAFNIFVKMYSPTYQCQLINCRNAFAPALLCP